MGKAGRPGVPAEIKRLSGTLRKDRMRSGINFDLVTAVPDPEVWMQQKAKPYFKKLCQMLIDKQILDQANVPLVAFMADCWATYEKACREIKKEGEIMELKGGYKQASPWMAIKNQAARDYRDVASLFGLDPISSQKIGQPVRSEGDEFDKISKEHNKIN